MRSSRGFGAMVCLVGESITWTVGPSETDAAEDELYGPVAQALKGVLAHRTDSIIDNDLRGGSV